MNNFFIIIKKLTKQSNKLLFPSQNLEYDFLTLLKKFTFRQLNSNSSHFSSIHPLTSKKCQTRCNKSFVLYLFLFYFFRMKRSEYVQTTNGLMLLQEHFRSFSSLFFIFLSPFNRFLPGFAPFVDGTVIVNPAITPITPITIPMGAAIAG